MNYGEILKDSQGKAAEGLLATKIMDLMDKLRLGATDLSARRWIWELLQNAKDTAYEDSPVKISIHFNDDILSPSLAFKHNGQPFSSDNITSLIHQVSSKRRRKEDDNQKKKPTGKFGTGFLSTHLLSEIVEVQGVVKEDNLPYKGFRIELDRRAMEYDDVIKSVKDSIDTIAFLLDSEDSLKHYDSKELNTIFTYQLEDEKIAVAEKGIADLHVSLPFTLAFSQDIAEVLIEHQQVSYHVEDRKTTDLEGLEIVTILENDISKDFASIRKIAVLTGPNTVIAFEIEDQEDQIAFKAFEAETPRLFCDFPLVGSENFPFPVVINSPTFNINEPRNGVWLTAINDKRIKHNEALMEEAATLLDIIMKYAGDKGWKNLYEFARIEPAIKSEWLSKDWFDNSILKQVRDSILYRPIVDSIKGRVAIYDSNDRISVMFPNAKTPEIRERIWDLGKEKYNFPLLPEVHKWSEVIWKNSLMINLPKLADFIKESINIEGLQKSLGMSEEAFEWLDRFYETMNLDTDFEDQVIADKYTVIPNQSDQFCIKTELKLAKEAQDEIKDVLELLGVSVRDTLVSEYISTGPRVFYNLRSEQSLIDDINTLLKSQKSTAEQKYAACDYLVSLFPAGDENNLHRTKMYNFSKTLYEDIGEKKIITNNTELWKEGDKFQLKTIAVTIAGKKNVKDFSEEYGFTEPEAIIFLDNFITFLKENELESQLTISSRPLLPNQHGVFKTKDELSLDDGLIPEELKIVAEKLGYDLRTQLLEKGIYLDLPENRTVNASHVANEINIRVMASTAINPRPEYIKDAFRTLLLYFISNPEQSEQLFADLHQHKHRLYDEEEIANNMKQAEDVKELMEELQIESMEELRKLLSRGISKYDPNNPELEQITTEILASWGISTMEQYKELLGTDVDSQIFKHYSVPTIQMLNYAQELIERAKDNIVQFLDQHPDYDTSDRDLIAPTTFAGITKRGMPIHVVFRPGDNKEVLFYYPSEKATLDLDNAELWVDDGKNDPFHLTLGKILQSTGINRIPIDGLN